VGALDVAFAAFWTFPGGRGRRMRAEMMAAATTTTAPTDASCIAPTNAACAVWSSESPASPGTEWAIATAPPKVASASRAVSEGTASDIEADSPAR
jgi:predicted anti-sigma-YlaC factor YlaD